MEEINKSELDWMNWIEHCLSLTDGGNELSCLGAAVQPLQAWKMDVKQTIILIIY